MKVQCENCRTRLNLPDDKLEPGAEFQFNCPKCKHRNTVLVKGPEQEEGPQEKPTPPEPMDFDDEETPFGEFFEEGAKPALVCFDDGPMKERLAEALEDIGFTPVFPNGGRDALERLRVTQYNALVLDENYDGQNRDRNVILRLLQNMEMTVRRRIWVALFGEEFQTFDHMTAYQFSVNTVINIKESNDFKKIIKRGVAEYERFYKVYLDVLKEMGKA